MKVLIIEDEAPSARRLRKLIEEYDQEIEVLDVTDSIESSVNWLTTHEAPEIIFSDIQLADGLSFEIFNRIKINTPVIFTTAFDEYSIRAFKVNSIDYLLKPIEKEDLFNSLEKYKTLKKQLGSTASSAPDITSLLEQLLPVSNYKNRFLVKLGEKLLSLTTDQIAYFHSEEKLTLLVTKENRKYPIDYSLDDLEKILQPNSFFRINRQFIANIEAINSTHSYFNGKLKLFLTPDSGKETIVSRDKASEFKDWLDGK